MMTKFIEGAREIEMDAVAKDGKVCEVLPLASFSYHLQPRSQGFSPWREGGGAGSKNFARRFWL